MATEEKNISIISLDAKVKANKITDFSGSYLSLKIETEANPEVIISVDGRFISELYHLLLEQ